MHPYGTKSTVVSLASVTVDAGRAVKGPGFQLKELTGTLSLTGDASGQVHSDGMDPITG